MLRLLVLLCVYVHASDIVFENYIGIDLDLYDEDALPRVVDLTEATRAILENLPSWAQKRQIDVKDPQFLTREVFVIDKIDSIFTTKLKKIVPGASMEELSKEPYTFIDHGLYLHNIFNIEHYPSKVELHGHIATITPIFRPR